jgi:RNA polymerase sigma-70 factor (ECF subfamily)
MRASLSSFLALPVVQRSAVILKDVLGCSLEEIAETTGRSVLAVKAALVRGRSNLQAQPQGEPIAWRDRPETTPEDRALLDRYCTLFNARDWAGVQALLSEECRLDLVAKASRRGKNQISNYFGNYANEDTRVSVAIVEAREILAVYRPSSSPQPTYVISLECDGEKVHLIRDYRYVPYLVDEIAFEEEERDD